MFACVCFPKLFRDMWEIDAIIQLGANSVTKMFLEFRCLFFFFFWSTWLQDLNSPIPRVELRPQQ